MAIKKYLTDYNRLKNRCYQCGHRLTMRDERGACTVVTGAEGDNSILVPCTCKRVRIAE